MVTLIVNEYVLEISDLIKPPIIFFIVLLWKEFLYIIK